jgi:tRNA (guanine9-N1)-methyltransferase
MENNQSSGVDNKIDICKEIPQIHHGVELQMESKISQPVSKNMLKKMRRKEEWDNKKKQIRKIKKEKKKEKNKIINKIINKTELVKEESPVIAIATATAIPRKVREEEYLKKVKEGSMLIIDCSFESLMNEKDIFSLTRQVGYCYSENRKAKNPFNFILYDVGERLMKELNKNNFSNWKGVTVIKKGEYSSITEYVMKHRKSDIEKENIIYLTADSENEVNDIETSKVYIIGGIVDRNRYKLITLNKANEMGIGHGRFPIGDYIQLNSSKVLTTNHVFAIMTYFNSIDKNWKDAFTSIIPKRKFEE